jgi:beta-1,4-mannosyl-glycoprotein beta-1,4-N-acetylglucosaminyltransferase
VNSPRQPKIIDCFTFFNELDILEGRLQYLYDHVDWFVIVEGNVTHTGKSKPLNFLDNISRYSRYLDKILYFPWTHDTSGMSFGPIKTVDYESSSWLLENAQRNHISEALKFFRDEDICLIGDADEIPSRKAIYEIKNQLKFNPAAVLQQKLYAYNLNQSQVGRWPGTVATRVCIAIDQTPQTIRDKRWGEMHSIEDAGWHLTYWGGVERIREKLINFSHQELVNEQTTDLGYINSRVASGQDLFGRNFAYTPADPYKEPIDFLQSFGKYVGIHVDPKLIAPYSETVEGWFNADDMEFYRIAYDHLPNDSHIVEIGSWKGRSSSHMAVMIANGDKRVKFDCVDTWKGSEEHQAGAGFEDADVLVDSLYDRFVKNMSPVKDYYNPVKATSVDAALLYRNNSLDMVFIDAAHDYDNVFADITAWAPKVKPGGIISGHDYPYPDVARAVADTLGTVYSFGSCWYVVKNTDIKLPATA